jgi:acetyltransferase-like isoleucine patch superfamily enzyme
MIKIVKLVLLGFFVICVSPLILLTRLGYLFRFEEFLDMFGKMLSVFPGRPGSYLRIAYYKFVIRSIHSSVHIDFGSFLSRRDTVIEPGVVIGAYSIIGQAHIKKNTLISSRVSILSGKYQHGKALGSSGQSLKDNKMEFEKVLVGSGCWIGENVIIMDDVGDQCIVSAGSVITKKIPDHSLAIGNPARIMNRENWND